VPTRDQTAGFAPRLTSTNALLVRTTPSPPPKASQIRELAQAEGVFVGPAYTGKGFASMLDHIYARHASSPAAHIAFLHTGDVETSSKSRSVGNVACA
jgi:hypothetical protein